MRRRPSFPQVPVAVPGPVAAPPGKAGGQARPDGTWLLPGTDIGIDMAAARDIWRDRLRAERAEAFKDLDVRMMLAVESDDLEAKAAIAAMKRRLRDVTADERIERAATPDDLMALTLDALTGGPEALS